MTTTKKILGGANRFYGNTSPVSHGIVVTPGDMGGEAKVKKSKLGKKGQTKKNWHLRRLE